jgi:hypothetical protein
LPQTSKETKNSQSLEKHGKQLKELLKFDIELPQDSIEDIIVSPAEWAEEIAGNVIMSQIFRYNKAKKLGEKFAREITD